MKANELRVGNFILEFDCEPYYFPIESIYINNVGVYRCSYRKQSIDTTLDMVEPIPLTEEWLLKFGFTKNESKIIDSYSISISKLGTLKKLSVTIQFGNEYVMIREGENDKPSSEDSIITLLNGDTHGRPFYIHQIQNLYFALTGEELTIKGGDK
jgi:hypothetical protein